MVCQVLLQPISPDRNKHNMINTYWTYIRHEVTGKALGKAIPAKTLSLLMTPTR
jgi:hypothetical protein